MIDCYILDNNGYIVVSENKNDTGRFFGEIDGAIMESMLENKTFDRISVYDFQAICTWLDASSDSNILLTVQRIVNIVFKKIIYNFL